MPSSYSSKALAAAVSEWKQSPSPVKVATVLSPSFDILTTPLSTGIPEVPVLPPVFFLAPLSSTGQYPASEPSSIVPNILIAGSPPAESV